MKDSKQLGVRPLLIVSLLFLGLAPGNLFSAGTGGFQVNKPIEAAGTGGLTINKPIDGVGTGGLVINHVCTTADDCTKFTLSDPCDQWTCEKFVTTGLPAATGVCKEVPLDNPEYGCCKAGIHAGDPDWNCCMGIADPKLCDDGSDCTKDACVGTVGLLGPDGNVISGGYSKCTHTTIPGVNCLPPPVRNDCALKHPGDAYAEKCCAMGFDTDPATEKCCVEHLTHGEDPGTPANPKPCGECPKCPEPPPPPKVDCSLIGDPKIQKCCTEVYDKMGKFLFLSIAIDKCVDDGDSNGCNEFVKALGDVSITDSIVCCQFINNSVCESGSCIQNCEKIVNTCPGNPGGTGGTTGGTTTSAAAGACEVQCKDKDCSIAVDTGGQGVAWVVNYTPPPGIGTVASAVLKQVEGPTMTADDPAASGTNALSIKSITDPSSLPPFVIYTAKPTSMMGTYLPKFKVEVQLNDLADNPLATLTCGNDAALEAKGSGGCGCYLGASPLEFGVNALLLALIGAPFVYSRRRARRLP